MRQTTSRIYRWQFGEAEFDESKWTLLVDGLVRTLEPRPLNVLQLLLRRAGCVVTKDEFYELVWPNVMPGEKALQNAIGKLRKTIGDENHIAIETVHKIGYRLVAPVTKTVIHQ